jgi:hypothetical protein
MDISTDNCQSNSGRDRPGLFSDAMRFMLGVLGRLIGIFTLTEADRMKAGIHIRRQGT